MERMIAFCGIDCNQCDAFLATQRDDNAKRKEVAQSWSQRFNMPLKPEDINCDGCVTEGKRLIGHGYVCEIRNCGKEKHVVNCAYCDDYACEKLTKFLAMVPYAKSTLDGIKKGL